MNLKKAFCIAFITAVVGVVGWELYWRSQGYIPTIDDNKALWAIQRDRVDTLDTDAVVFLGSSRTLYGIQLDSWEKETGKRPVQLANVGSSPLPVFHDIVANTNYSGTVVVGVAPGLFFSTTYPKAQPWAWPQARVDHHKNRTYVQRLNHQLSLPLQQHLALMSAGEEALDDNIDLKTLLKQIKVGNRIPEGMPPFYKFGRMTTLDRNLQMTDRTVTDTAFAHTITKVWEFIGKTSPAPDKAATMAFFLKDVKAFKARGGHLILMRCPSTYGVRAGENFMLPRQDYWDDLVEQSDVMAYHFEDYPQFKDLKCPEWSHLSAKDAHFFTAELAKLMLADKAIINPQTN